VPGVLEPQSHQGCAALPRPERPHHHGVHRLAAALMATATGHAVGGPPGHGVGSGEPAPGDIPWSMAGKEDLSALAESSAAGYPNHPVPDKAGPSFPLTSMSYDRFSRSAQMSGCAGIAEAAHSAGLGSGNPYALLLTRSWLGPGERSICRAGAEPELHTQSTANCIHKPARDGK
jgi:hypothetical protein